MRLDPAASSIAVEYDYEAPLSEIATSQQKLFEAIQQADSANIVSLIPMLAGVVFALNPVFVIVINNGSAILAELNGLRPLLGSSDPKPTESNCK